MFDTRPTGPRAYGNPYAPPEAVWTPNLVGETLLDCMRWAKATAGRVGPRGFAKVAGLAWTPTLDDHLREGWGLPPEPDPEDQRRPTPIYTQGEIRIFSAALHWQSRYLADAHAGSSRMLGLWLRSRVHGENLTEELRKLGVAKGHAYRLRDRALSKIAIGLTADRVPVPQPIVL